MKKWGGEHRGGQKGSPFGSAMLLENKTERENSGNGNERGKSIRDLKEMDPDLCLFVGRACLFLQGFFERSRS